MRNLLLFHAVVFTLAISIVQVHAQIVKNDTGNVKPIGKLYDIGGYYLHLNCTGKGEPSVILISGALAFSFDWTLVQDRLQKYAKICSYDRPGLAWSDPGPMPRSFAQDVYELHKLLEAAKIKPPYILVGHSVGGIIARKFAKEYPNEVSGLVLVDATSENSLMDINGKIERLRLLASPDKKIPPLKEKVDTLIRIPSAKEIEEFWSMMGKPSISQPFDKLPVPIQKARIWAQSLPKYYTADNGDFWSEEFAQMFSESLAYKIGNKPLIILCSTKNEYPKELGQAVTDSLMTDKMQNQKRFLDISLNSKLMTTANSGHEIHLTEPDLIVDAIKQVISSVKTKQKLK